MDQITTSTQAEEKIIMVIKKKSQRQLTRFIELFMNKQDYTTKEICAVMSRSSLYDFIMAELYEVNLFIQRIHPEIGSFIAPSFCDRNGKIITGYKKNDRIEIITQDPNYLYLKVRENDKR